MSRTFLICLALAVSLSLAGCGQVSEKATGAAANRQEESVTVKGKEGESLTITATVPDELKSFPVPAGFRSAGGAYLSPAGGEKLAAATWKGKSSLDEVAGFYKKNSPGQGWVESSSFAYSALAQFQYVKDPGQSLIATINKSGEEVEISVLMGKTAQKKN